LSTTDLGIKRISLLSTTDLGIKRISLLSTTDLGIKRIFKTRNPIFFKNRISFRLLYNTSLSNPNSGNSANTFASLNTATLAFSGNK